MRRPILLSFVFSVCAYVPGPVIAQVDDNEAVALEEIVVTGQRLSQKRALDFKREAVRILDAVSADELGRLPDKNAAEAVDRLPGVSITIDQGEGRFVSIRGVSPTLNNLTINGISAGSPEADSGGRLAPLDVIGGDLLQRIEVIKAPTPDMDAQGIGGTINVVTPSPLQNDNALFGNLEVRAGDQEFGGDMPYGLEFTVGGRTEDRRWGYLVGASYSERDFITRGIYPDDWREFELDGVTTRAPLNDKHNRYGLERTRRALNATIEFSPSAGNTYFARAYLSSFDEDEERQRTEHQFNRSITALFPDGGISGDDNRREQELRVEEKDKEFRNLALGGNNVLGAWTLDYQLQFNDNSQTEPHVNWEFRGGDYGPDTWRIDDRGFTTIEGGGQDLLDPSFIEFRRLRFQDNETDEQSVIGSFDARLDGLWGDREGYLKFGFKAADTDRENDGRRTRFNPGSEDWFLGPAGLVTGQFSNPVDGTPYRGLRIDPALAAAFFAQNQNNPAFFEFDAEDTFEQEFQSDYDIDERIIAAYGMASVAIGPATLVGGVRVERTSVDAVGFRRDVDTLSAVAVTDEGSYTNVLPALILTIPVLDNRALIRAAWTNTVGRADYNQLAPISVLDRDGTLGSLTIGNPDLEPRQASSFDLAFEYYFEDVGIFSAGVFYKDIDDFIVSRSVTQDNFTFEGELFERFTTRTFENADSANLRGFELNFQKQLAFLPGVLSGLGVTMSYAYIDSETQVAGRDGDFPLLNQPDWTRSFALTYQKGPIQAALSIDESDSFLTSLEGNSELDLFEGAYGRVDFKASYAFDAYSIFLEWQNINNEPSIEFQGGDERQLTRFEEYGETLYLGFNARF